MIFSADGDHPGSFLKLTGVLPALMTNLNQVCWRAEKKRRDLAGISPRNYR
jgi:hypothetical protein